MRTRAGWGRFLAPAAFLLAVTIAVLVVRSGLETGRRSGIPRPGAVTTAPTPPATRRRFYVVRAGDTLGTIAAKTGVPLARLRRLNPRVRSTALFIGERIRLR
jgi:LysM repeat protein